jgi:hypothetical protein
MNGSSDRSPSMAAARPAGGPSAPPRRSRAQWAAIGVVALLLASAFVVYGVPSASVRPTPPSGGSRTADPGAGHAASAGGVLAPAGGSSGVRLPTTPAGSPPASGRGTFYNGVNLAQPAPTNLSCFTWLTFIAAATCPNTTFDPSINVTSNGTIGVAFTAFTNSTRCASVANVSSNTTVDVAFQRSTTGGASWSKLQYLGNQNCSEALNFTDAWQPSLTSLSNGTFVLTYTEFNTSRCSPLVFFCEQPVVPEIFPYQMPNSALVVQESYNGGVSWTAPQVLNQTFNVTAEQGACGVASGSPLYHPWVSASGSSVYLVYENITDANGCSLTSPYSAGVHLIESTNGGSTWSAPVNFPTVGDGGIAVYGSPTNFSVNPYVLAAPNGQVYVAYSTGLEGPSTFCVSSGCVAGGTNTQDVVVANATGGTGSWTVHYAATNEPFDANAGSGSYGDSPFDGIHPQLAYDGTAGQLYLTYNSQSIGSFCSPNAAAPPTCASGLAVDSVVFQNSSNGGANWSQPVEVGGLLNPYNGTMGAEYYPTIAVDHNGTVDVMFQYYNDSSCGVTAGYAYCGEYEQVVLNTTDNGASWGAPGLLSESAWTPLDGADTGEYETATTAPSGATYYAWTSTNCTIASGGPVCQFGRPNSVEPNTTVVVSWLFAGAGVSLTFHETNLTTGLTWSTDVFGNVRSAPAGTNLVVSGVPTTEPVGWSVGWLNVSAGVAWQPVAAATNPVPPATFATSTTLDFTFQEFVQVTVVLNPPMPAVNLTPNLFESTYSMSPLPGTFWAASGSSFALTVLPQAISCVVSCNYDNITWVSWTGVGNGSLSTNATVANLPVGSAPVTETANFLDNGHCQGIGGLLSCSGPYGYPLSFVETGLPAGTPWGVTVTQNTTPGGTVSTSSFVPWLNVTVNQTASQYTLWTVPSATSGSYWVPTSTPASPVKEPIQSVVSVTYALATAVSQTFDANFTATGLPNGTAWSADVGASSYAVTDGSLQVPVAGGTGIALNGSDVYTEDGVAFYAASIAVFPLVENTTVENTTNLTTPFWFNGSADVVISYQPMFWLSVSASAGGTVTPASRWVESGASVMINATPETGFRFLEWTGAGAGSSTALQEHDNSTTINPSAPVTELATFRPIPLPTWNVTVSSQGLPAGVGVAFTLGTLSYSGSGGSVVVGELESGSYRFSTPTVYGTASNGTRWVATSETSSFGPLVNGAYPIDADGTITVSYTTEFALTVASGPGGSVSPTILVGSTWQTAGTTWELTANASYHYVFTGWNASGPGTASASTTTTSVRLQGPTWETATFAYRTFPAPAVFSLRVTESGLPSGYGWNVTVGSGNTSAAGAHPTLNLTGLNGTYALVVPAVYGSLGTRYVANGSRPISVTVVANRSATVAFTEQFALTVLAGAGGTVTGLGTTWVGAGSTASINATPNSGDQFVGWTGAGTGAATPYSGPAGSSTLVVNGPTNETATFAPVPTTHTSGTSASTGEAIGIGLLVVLLVVGLVLGVLLGRRRREAPPSGGDGPGDGSAAADAPPTDGST